MLATSSPRIAAPNVSWLPIASVLAISGVALVGRIAMSGHTPLGWFRICVSLAALALVVCGHRRNVLKRALFAIALEVIGGCAMFVYVDIPFVNEHTAQIATAATDVYGRYAHRDLTRDLARANLLPR